METTRLNRDRAGDQAQWLGADFLPGYGMNVIRLWGWLPGTGGVEIIAPPTPDALGWFFDPAADPHAWRSFKCGGAWLLPFVNRIWPTSGVVQTAGEIAVRDQRRLPGQELRLPEFDGYSGYALHGLALRQQFEDIAIERTGSAANLTAGTDMGNWDRRWPSRCRLAFSAHLSADAVTFAMTAQNTGEEPMPMAIGWHPYLNIVSGERAQARLHLPATRMLQLESYDSLRPTYQVLDVAGTPFDFSAEQGRALGDRFYDDCFVGLTSQMPEASLLDPASGCRITMRAESPEVHAIQIFSRPTDKCIAVEPQYNLTDPFDPRWQVETGVAILAPGESTTYRVTLRMTHVPGAG